MIENFVVDVSKSQSADMELTRQFRKIISFYSKASGGEIKDPKIKKLLDMLQENYSALETETGYVSRDESSESESESDSEEDNTTKVDVVDGITQ